LHLKDLLRSLINFQKRIKEKLEFLKKSPFVGLPLHGSLKGKCRIRVGDYRVIYKVSEKEKRVLFARCSS